MKRSIIITAIGTPVGRGERSAINMKTRKAYVYKTDKYQRWCNSIRIALLQQTTPQDRTIFLANPETQGAARVFLFQEFCVDIQFLFSRPKKHYINNNYSNALKPKFENAPHTPKPDIENLIKPILDVITKAGFIWKDDSQVTMIRASKQYADANNPSQATICITGK
jgi:Holliday junction resolvase RusA-like endonuclease